MYLAMFGLLIVLLFAMMSMDQPVSNLKYYQCWTILETERWRSTRSTTTMVP